MDTPHITPDQLQALADRHAFPKEVIMRVFDRMAVDHTNPVAGTHRILSKAHHEDRDPVDLAMRRAHETLKRTA